MDVNDRRRDSHVLVLVWMVFLLVSLTSPVLGETEYAIGEISVLDGNPVKGVDAIFRQRFNTRCYLTPATSVGRDFPISGSISSRIKLAVSVIGCNVESADSPAPSVTCSRRVGSGPREEVAATFGSHEDASWTYVLPLDVPDKIGIYEVELDCSIDGVETENPALVETRLFATYAKPLLVVSPPEIAWYERAAAWAEGIGKGDEVGLVEQMLENSYAYGQEHWRYGYSSVDERGRRWFRSHTSRYRVEAGPDLWVMDDDETKCHWEALMDPASPCNFADCGVFSRILQFSAATLGVGGLTICPECLIYGDDNAGFLTSATAKSLDDEFQRNIFCDAPNDLSLLGALQSTTTDSQCPAYKFGRHTILRRNDTYYDATFLGIYKNPNEVINVSVESGGKTVLLHDSSSTLRRKSIGLSSLYGNWSIYSFLPDTNLRSSAPGQIQFTSRPVNFERVQLDDIPLVFERITAAIEVDVDEPGVYSVWGYLADPDDHGDGAEAHVSSRSAWSAVRGTTAVVNADTKGTHTVKLSFSGEEIYRSKLNGPYALHAFISGRDEEKKCLTENGEGICLTPDYRFEDFGEMDVVIKRSEITAGWSFADEDFGSLVVYIPLTVREETAYAVQLALLQGETSIAYGGMKCEQPPCEPVAVLRVPRSELFAGHGAYHLTAEVFTYPGLHSMDSYRLELETPSQLITRISRK